jgi:MFS family permease
MRWRVRWKALPAVVAGVVAAFAPGIAFANGDHAAPAAGPSPTTLWLMAATIVLPFLGLAGWSWLAGARGNTASSPFATLAGLRRFSRNARLFLTYALLSGLGTGIWNVLFNLYLLRAGFDLAFIGLFWLVEMFFHGLIAFPAGLIGDKVGRRTAFVIATGVNIVARGTLLFVGDPAYLLVFAALAGIGEGFHGVAGAPFMMENSEAEERPLLFSLDSSFSMLSNVVGSITGGLLPLTLVGLLGVPPLDPTATRMALVISLPLTFASLAPLVFMRERPVALVENFRDLFALRNVEHHAILGRLALCTLLIGIAFGLSTRYFNVFFAEARHATDDQIGLIFAMGSMAGAGAVLIAPALTARFGRIRTIVLTQALSVPFLLLIVVLGPLPLVATAYLIRTAIYAVSMPLRSQLSMELVTSRERATTAGLNHMAFDLGGAAGAGAAGALLLGGGFIPAFAVAGIIFLVPAALYHVFFARYELRPAPLAAINMAR